MYAVGALDRALQLNADVWKSASLSARITHLAAAIRRGIEAYGIVQTPDGAVVYAYEVRIFRVLCGTSSETPWPLRMLDPCDVRWRRYLELALPYSQQCQ
jgi:hypothetical protein